MNILKKSHLVFGLWVLVCGILPGPVFSECPNVPYYVEGYAGAHRKSAPYPVDFGCGLELSKIKIVGVYKAYPLESSQCYSINSSDLEAVKKNANQHIDVTSRMLEYISGLESLKDPANLFPCAEVKRDDYLVLETLIRPGNPKRGLLITGWIVRQEFKAMFMRENDFDKYYEVASAKYAVMTGALKAITAYWSEFDPYKRSAGGRVGLMGLKVDEVRLGVDPDLKSTDLLSPEKNIECGARLFRVLLHHLGNCNYYDVAAVMGVPHEQFHRYFMYFSQKSGEPMSYFPDEVAGVKKRYV